MIFSAVLTIGDELLIGQVTDSNSAYIAHTLDQAGYPVKRKIACSDDIQDIIEALQEAGKHADIIITTGGLGPTSDDKTRFAIAKLIGCELEVHQQALRDLQEKYSLRGREMTAAGRLMATLPVTSGYVENPSGTAAGIWTDWNGKIIVSLPGVPREMKRMMDEEVIPKLATTTPGLTRLHKQVMIATLPESKLAHMIKEWEERLPKHLALAYLPGSGIIRLRLTGSGSTPEELNQEMEQQMANLLPYVKDFMFAEGQEELEHSLGNLLMKQKATISLAESCTGGYIQHLLTLIPGSSAYFAGGVVSYSNDLKMGILGVRAETLKEFGAVSEQCIIEMAEGARNQFRTTYAIATSGVAGPGGGTEEKPVGTVWVACAGPDGTTTKKLMLTKDRELNIKLSATNALFLLYKELQKKELAT